MHESLEAPSVCQMCSRQIRRSTEPTYSNLRSCSALRLVNHLIAADIGLPLDKQHLPPPDQVRNVLERHLRYHKAPVTVTCGNHRKADDCS